MNVLKRLIIPRMDLSIKYIKSELEEQEREDTFRLKRVKMSKMIRAAAANKRVHVCVCNEEAKTSETDLDKKPDTNKTQLPDIDKNTAPQLAAELIKTGMGDLIDIHPDMGTTSVPPTSSKNKANTNFNVFMESSQVGREYQQKKLDKTLKIIADDARSNVDSLDNGELFENAIKTKDAAKTKQALSTSSKSAIKRQPSGYIPIEAQDDSITSLDKRALTSLYKGIDSNFYQPTIDDLLSRHEIVMGNDNTLEEPDLSQTDLESIDFSINSIGKVVLHKHRHRSIKIPSEAASLKWVGDSFSAGKLESLFANDTDYDVGYRSGLTEQEKSTDAITSKSRATLDADSKTGSIKSSLKKQTKQDDHATSQTSGAAVTDEEMEVWASGTEHIPNDGTPDKLKSEQQRKAENLKQQGSKIMKKVSDEELSRISEEDNAGSDKRSKLKEERRILQIEKTKDGEKQKSRQDKAESGTKRNKNDNESWNEDDDDGFTEKLEDGKTRVRGEKSTTSKNEHNKTNRQNKDKSIDDSDIDVEKNILRDKGDIRESDKKKDKRREADESKILKSEAASKIKRIGEDISDAKKGLSKYVDKTKQDIQNAFRTQEAGTQTQSKIPGLKTNLTSKIKEFIRKTVNTLKGRRDHGERQGSEVNFTTDDKSSFKTKIQDGIKDKFNTLIDKIQGRQIQNQSPNLRLDDTAKSSDEKSSTTSKLNNMLKYTKDMSKRNKNLQSNANETPKVDAESQSKSSNLKLDAKSKVTFDESNAKPSIKGTIKNTYEKFKRKMKQIQSNESNGEELDKKQKIKNFINYMLKVMKIKTDVHGTSNKKESETQTQEKESQLKLDATEQSKFVLKSELKQESQSQKKIEKVDNLSLLPDSIKQVVDRDELKESDIKDREQKETRAEQTVKTKQDDIKREVGKDTDNTEGDSFIPSDTQTDKVKQSLKEIDKSRTTDTQRELDEEKSQKDGILAAKTDKDMIESGIETGIGKDPDKTKEDSLVPSDEQRDKQEQSLKEIDKSKTTDTQKEFDEQKSQKDGVLTAKTDQDIIRTGIKTGVGIDPDKTKEDRYVPSDIRADKQKQSLEEIDDSRTTDTHKQELDEQKRQKDDTSTTTKELERQGIGGLKSETKHMDNKKPVEHKSKIDRTVTLTKQSEKHKQDILKSGTKKAGKSHTKLHDINAQDIIIGKSIDISEINEPTQDILDIIANKKKEMNEQLSKIKFCKKEYQIDNKIEQSIKLKASETKDEEHKDQVKRFDPEDLNDNDQETSKVFDETVSVDSKERESKLQDKCGKKPRKCPGNCGGHIKQE